MAGDRARDGAAEGERPERAVPSGVIAVVRAGTAAQARTIVHGLVRAAVPAIELTLTVPEALTILAEAARMVARPGSQTVLGAGTVLDRRACQEAVAAGARFVVSPVTDPPVLEQAHRDGVPYVGGALTPTEVLASMRAGTDAVKLFPVGSVGGAAYLRALREPLPGLLAVVSGGIGALTPRDTWPPVRTPSAWAARSSTGRRPAAGTSRRSRPGPGRAWPRSGRSPDHADRDGTAAPGRPPLGFGPSGRPASQEPDAQRAVP